MDRICTFLLSISLSFCFLSCSIEDDRDEIDFMEYSPVFMDSFFRFTINGIHQVGNPYRYEDKLSNKGWQKLSGKERHDYFQIPEEMIERMTSLDLALTSIFYYPPLRVDIMASNYPMDYVSFLLSSYNGLTSLVELPDAGYALSAIYQSMNYSKPDKCSYPFISTLLRKYNALDNPFYQAYISLLLASDKFMGGLNEDELELILDITNERIDKLTIDNEHGIPIEYLYAVKARIAILTLHLDQDTISTIESLIHSVGSTTQARLITIVNHAFTKYNSPH